MRDQIVFFSLPPKIITRDYAIQSLEQCRHAIALSISGEEATHRCTQWADEGFPPTYKYLHARAEKKRGDKKRKRGRTLGNKGLEKYHAEGGICRDF